MDQLINEICEICTRVEPDVKPSSVFRRLQFMSYELSSQLPPSATTSQKLETLNQFFFKTKDFATPTEPSFHDPLSLNLLNRVLNSRVGSSRALSVIYRYLGEQIGLKFEFVDLQPNCYLKHIEQGLSRFVDLSREGKDLSSDELIKTLQSKAQTQPQISELCESLSLDQFIIEYLSVLKTAFQQRSHFEPLLIVQSWILEYQPSNMPVTGERAVLLSHLGHFRSAYVDLKRYFSFNDRAVAPKELVSLYDELTRKFANKPESILN